MNVDEFIRTRGRGRVIAKTANHLRGIQVKFSAHNLQLCLLTCLKRALAVIAGTIVHVRKDGLVRKDITGRTRNNHVILESGGKMTKVVVFLILFSKCYLLSDFVSGFPFFFIKYGEEKNHDTVSKTLLIP